MVARFLILVVVVVGVVPAAAAQRPRTAFDPNDPEKTRPVVSTEERERLGLAAKTWDGVVHPDVYTTLHRLNETVERLRNTNTGEAIDLLDRMRFQGTVYVQVLLKHERKGKGEPEDSGPALLNLQRRVLNALTAAEFHVRQLLEGSPGFVGHVNKEGLDKLAKHPDVLAVCLDDQPLPEPPRVVYKHQVPDPRPGEFDDELAVKANKVDVKVYQALKQSERVFVLVSLEKQGEPLPSLTHAPSAMNERSHERAVAVRQLQDRVLSTLSADEFWLWTRLGGLPGFGGYLSRQGVEKLWKHPEVGKFGLEGLKQHGWRKPSPARSSQNP
jgi:hypothetical protein